MSKKKQNTRQKLYDIIFLADTPAGKAFDIALLIAIVISVIAVILDSVASIREKIGHFLFILEWVVTILFSLEYILRIYVSRKPYKYIFSFYGIIDLLAILPTYLSLVLVGSHYLVVIRILRILRVFRVLKLGRFLKASDVLMVSLKESRHKIIIFVEVVFIIVVIMGSLMYLIEGPRHGFTSIPRGIYWAIVTLTTVGYGDIAPSTPLGQALSSIIMIMGYAIIAVPTGIFTVEMSRASHKKITDKGFVHCNSCGKFPHEVDAEYCKYCGARI